MTIKQSKTERERHAEKSDAEALALLEIISPMNRIPMERYLNKRKPSPAVIAALAFVAIDLQKSLAAKNAADVRHNLPGGSRDLKNQLLNIWATGKYSSRDICAEQEYSELGYKSLKTARNALLNSPDPSPWPAKKRHS